MKMPKIFNDFRQDSINIDNIDINLLNGKINNFKYDLEYKYELIFIF